MKYFAEGYLPWPCISSGAGRKGDQLNWLFFFGFDLLATLRKLFEWLWAKGKCGPYNEI
jgi:hypothetical protein